MPASLAGQAWKGASPSLSANWLIIVKPPAAQLPTTGGPTAIQPHKMGCRKAHTKNHHHLQQHSQILISRLQERPITRLPPPTTAQPTFEWPQTAFRETMCR